MDNIGLLRLQYEIKFKQSAHFVVDLMGYTWEGTRDVLFFSENEGILEAH